MLAQPAESVYGSVATLATDILGRQVAIIFAVRRSGSHRPLASRNRLNDLLTTWTAVGTKGPRQDSRPARARTTSPPKRGPTAVSRAVYARL